MSTLNSTTPSLESLLPKNVPTPEEVRANKKLEDSTSFIQGAEDAINSRWISGWLFRQLDAGSVGYYDPDFTVTDPRYWPKLTEGIDPAYYEMFGEATNINMAMKIRQQALSIQESRRRLAAMPGGTALELAATILDPTFIAANVVSGGFAGGAAITSGATRAAALARGAISQGAATLATEGYRTYRDPLVTTKDLAENVVGAAIGGASFSGFTDLGRLARFGVGAAGSGAASLPYIMRSTEASEQEDNALLWLGISMGIGGIANAIPKTIRAQQAVRAGTATVEETPTSFIIRQKQLTEAPPRTPEPGLVVWQRPMQARDFINRGENPTQWNDVEVPKMKNFDWRPDVADEATRFGQAVPMRSTGTTPTLARRQPLALPESANVLDSTPSGQPLASGSTIRDPALPATPKYPSVDEMIAEVDRTGIDPYADVIVDPATGTYEPIPDNVPIDPDTGEPMIDAVLAPENLDEVKFGDAIPADAPKQPWEMRPSQFRDWSYTQDFKAKRSAAESAEKLASDAVIKLEQEIGASSKGVSSVVTSLDGVSVKSFGIMQMAMAAREQAEFDAALSKMPKEFQERHAKAVYEYELAHARTRTFEGIDTAKEMLAEYPDLAAPAPKQPWEMTRRGEGTDAFIGTDEDGAIAARIMNDEVGVRVAANPNGRSSERVIRDNMAERLAKGTDPELSSRISDAVQKERNAVNRSKLLEDSFTKEDWQIPLSILKERGDGIRQLENHRPTVERAIREGKPVPPEVLADYPDLKPNSPTEIPDPRTLEERLTSKIDEINRRRKNSPGIPRGDNTGGTILFAEMVDLVHELALRAVRAGVRGVDNLGKLFDELVAGKDPEIQKLRKDIIAQADDYVNEPELIEAKHRIARQRAEKADEIRGSKTKAAPKETATSGNTPPPPTETPPGVGGTPKGPGDFDLGGREYKGDATPDPSFGKVRFSMSSALQSSSSQFARWLGKVTGETAVMSKGWLNNAAEKFGDSASEATDRVFRAVVTRLVAETDPIWKKYAEHNKLNFVERVIRDKFRDEFHDKIGIAIRAGRSDDPFIEAARKAYVKHFNDLLEYGKKYGLPGFDKIPPDETYLWRVWDHSKIAKMTDKHTHSSLVELLTKAARTKNQDLDEAATREVMGYFLDALHNRQYGLDLDKNLAFTSARDTVESVIDALGLERNKAQDLINRAKGRMVLDENASIETAAGTLRLSDLLDNNAETIAHVYARNVIGASHMQEVFRAAEGYWGGKINSLGELLDLISRDGAAVGADPERLKYDIRKAKAISEAILGHRSAEATYWTKASIAIRGINHLARSGSFAIAQIPEAGRVIAGGGIQAAINNMPVMKDILTSIYSGKPDTRLLQEIQEIWALGTEPLVNHPVRRFDFREAGDQFLNYSQFNRQLNKAQYWASNISGMTYIQNVQQKWAGAAFVNTWANMKSMPTKARLTTLGLDEAMAQKIMDNIKQHATTETGPLGVRVKQLNIEKWDKDAASKFIVAGDKWTRNAVQQNNVALYSEWMTKDTGKVLVQFRSFAVQAYEKQFLQPGQILIASRGKDFQAWMDFMVPVFIGGLAYIAQTHMNSIGRADRDKYLKDMLSDEKIGLGAFNRGGAASILPMATDWVSDSLGYGKPFGYARTSGLESHPLLGNPTFDVLANTPESLRTLRAAIDPKYNATQTDMRNLRKVVPGQNLPVVKNILDYYQTRLPKERYQR